MNTNKDNINKKEIDQLKIKLEKHFEEYRKEDKKGIDQIIKIMIEFFKKWELDLGHITVVDKTIMVVIGNSPIVVSYNIELSTPEAGLSQNVLASHLIRKFSALVDFVEYIPERQEKIISLFMEGNKPESETDIIYIKKLRDLDCLLREKIGTVINNELCEAEKKIKKRKKNESK